MEKIRCIVINMEKDTDRKAHMKNLLTELGFRNIKFIFPFEGNLTTLYNIKKKYPNFQTLPSSRISSFATYINILENEQEEQFILFEDDIVPVENIEITKQNIIKSLTEYPKDAHLVYLEYCMEKCYKRQRRKDNFYRLNSHYCAAAIFYPSKNKKLELLEILKKFPITFETFDNAINYLTNKQTINIYSLGLIFRQYYTLFGSQIEGSPKKESFECIDDYLDKIKQSYQNKVSNKNYSCVALFLLVIFIVLLYIFLNKRHNKQS